MQAGFRQVNPEQPLLLHMKEDDASCDEANNRGGAICDDGEPPLRLFVEQELPRSLFDHQSVNGEMHKDVRQVITPTAARSEQLNIGGGAHATMNAPTTAGQLRML